MPPPKRVLCVMDLSVAGRAGLSAVLPALAACGVQACGLPAALFSTHTGGFGQPARQDEADFGQAAMDHFVQQGIAFDAVYVGYLYGDGQFALAQRALALWPNALHLVDPALGDDGKRYTGLDDEAVARMCHLCGAAQLITPNFTESALLLGQSAAWQGSDTPDAAGLTSKPGENPPQGEKTPPHSAASLDEPTACKGEAEAARRLDKLCTQSRSVLITSVPVRGGYASVGRAAGQRETFVIPSRRVPQRYPGTGDLLAAAVCGLLLRGAGLEQAARQATAFVESAALATHQGGGEARHGLWFEPFLPMLGAMDSL